jgi:hypothetical protein
VRFEVLIMVSMKTSVFRDLMLCSPVESEVLTVVTMSTLLGCDAMWSGSSKFQRNSIKNAD